MTPFRAVLTVISLSLLIAGNAFAWAARPPEVYGQKRHGIIMEIPKGRTGIWKVTGERVEVSKETDIVEAEGKAEPGAFVEVTGKDQGNVFKAYRIEVKLPKK